MAQTFPSVYPHLPDFGEYESVGDYSVLDAPVIIALHSLARGPALGGTRWRAGPHVSLGEDIQDALRLSAVMTLKNAIHRLPFGGGKAVIAVDPASVDRRAFLREYAALLNRINRPEPRFYASEDMGMSADDILFMAKYTRFITGLPAGEHKVKGEKEKRRGCGGPAGMTVYGVIQGIRACLETCYGGTLFNKHSFVLSGLGNVGYPVLEKLLGGFDGTAAKVFVADVDPAKVDRALSRNPFGKCLVEAVAPEDALACDVDVVVPCGPGGIVNDATLGEFRCRIICGSANNQLARAGLAEELMSRGILWAPDYVVNGGGVIEAAEELDPRGYLRPRALDKTLRIYDLCLGIFKQAEKEGTMPSLVADRMAYERLQNPHE